MPLLKPREEMTSDQLQKRVEYLSDLAENYTRVSMTSSAKRFRKLADEYRYELSRRSMPVVDDAWDDPDR
jgi:hypothetical protein